MNIMTNYGVKIAVACTWGDGPDVLINVHDHRVSTKGFTPGFYGMDLTGDQAIQMGEALIAAGKKAHDWDKTLAAYYECREQKGESDDRLEQRGS